MYTVKSQFFRAESKYKLTAVDSKLTHGTGCMLTYTKWEVTM